MAIAPINYATIQRTTDVETFKTQQDAKPVVDQQNIQVQQQRHEEAARTQVLEQENSEKLDNHADAREEGKNKYKGNPKKREKKTPEASVHKREPYGGGFDIKI